MVVVDALYFAGFMTVLLAIMEKLSRRYSESRKRCMYIAHIQGMHLTYKMQLLEAKTILSDQYHITCETASDHFSLQWLRSMHCNSMCITQTRRIMVQYNSIIKPSSVDKYSLTICGYTAFRMSIYIFIYGCYTDGVS